MQTLQNIYKYRAMIQSLIKRELRGRYRGSILGFAWTFINPLLQLIVYSVVFSVIMRNGIKDYYLFLFVALIPWIFFSTSLNEGAGCIRNNATLVEKIYFPREVLPISTVSSQFINMLLSFIVVFIALEVGGKSLKIIPLIYLPVVLIVEYMIVLGLVFIFSGITVYFKDFQYIISVILMAWQFMSPVMYGTDMVPDQLKVIFFLNPMSGVLEAVRTILYYQTKPNLIVVFESGVEGIVFMIIGLFTFKKLETRFVENI